MLTLETWDVYIGNIDSSRTGFPSMRPILRLSALAIVAVVLLSGCGRESVAEDSHGDRRSVRVAAVELREGSRELRMSGITRATRRATLAFLVSGTLVERAADLGSRVSKGEEVARLYNPSLEPAVAAGQARIRELDARLDQLERDLQRATDLRQRGLISQEDLERVSTDLSATRAARDLAKADLAEARNRLHQSRLVAPFDGSVTDVRFEIGEYVAAGQPVIQLSALDQLEVELSIPETLIDRFEAGREVELDLTFLPGRKVKGRVVRTGDSGGQAGGLFPVEIALEPTPGIRPGLTVELVLPLPSTPSRFVPLAAILDPGTGRPRVFRIVDGRVQPVFVTVGQLYGDTVEVSGDLGEGDLVAVTGLSSLTPGQAVEILE
jgi:multidrug efflux system membrane fusion protein